ncbi:hypothetical protein JCM12296A_44530 [Desulfosarcina cetonica]|uniref:ExeA family protein n=1 Tax=Desulfosarcina cetonica TaxID=90730 RepID=UPI0006D24A25|nr:AAA family ATPase [Desulfosarcina cetonica]
MYKSFFGLNKKPFQITTDPSFLWMGKKHREALSTLKYGVMDNKGFLLITGDVGTGKTTLINRLVEDIKDRAYTAKVPDPGLSKYDFYRMVARYFGLPIEVRTKSDFLEPFSRFLNDARAERKSVLLLIDEAQRLKHDLMEEIRLLSNLEHQDAKLLNIFFVGQNEFNAILMQPENRALMRRITITYNIEPLDPVETREYIRHRLKTAGAGYEIFSTAAMEEVFQYSKGFPRQINIICDLAMFFASQLKQRTINRKVVTQCRERLTLKVDTGDAETKDNLRAPAPRHHYRPPQKQHARWIAPALLALMLLVLIFTSAFLFPADWQHSAGQWIQQTYRRYFQPVPSPPHPLSMDVEDEAPSRVSFETYDLQPPNTDAGTVPSDLPPSDSSPRATHRPPTDNPDPGAAIDWLLNQRRPAPEP